MGDQLPAIPARLEHRPVRNGVALPWGNAALADGGVDFRSHHNAHWLESWQLGLCQVCGQTLTHPAVLLCGETALKHLLFNEPPAHPECAVYTSRVCPMVAGQRTHYADRPLVSSGPRGKTCPLPGCGCGGWMAHPDTTQAGRPAPSWFAVYVRTYRLAVDPEGQLLGGLCTPREVLTVRLVSRPGEGRCWLKVPDALDGYEPPEIGLLRREDRADRG